VKDEPRTRPVRKTGAGPRHRRQHASLIAALVWPTALPSAGLPRWAPDRLAGATAAPRSVARTWHRGHAGVQAWARWWTPWSMLRASRLAAWPNA